MQPPRYVVPQVEPDEHHPIRPPHSGLVPLCLMLVLAKLQGTTTQGFLSPGSVGGLAGMSPYTAGILLAKAFDCGYVRRVRHGGGNIYGLSALGFRWLQLWAQDVTTSCASTAHVQGLAAPVNPASLLLTADYQTLCSDWMNVVAETLGMSGTANPHLLDALNASPHGPAAVTAFCYRGHWTSNLLQLDTPEQFQTHWWPVWSQEWRLTPPALSRVPG